MTQPVSPLNTEFQWQICSEADITYATHQSKLMAASIGFSSKAQWEVAISISEAAANILKHAGKGQIFIRLLPDAIPPLVEFEASDDGPGFDDLSLATKDGVSRGFDMSQADDFDINVHIVNRDGLGAGLGAIQRMMDECHIMSLPQGGTLLRARKFLFT